MEIHQALAALSALAHEHRLRAVRHLIQAGAQGLSVGALRDKLDIPPATLSAHLKVLRAAGLIRDQREGRSIRLSADYPQLDALLAYLTENCCAGSPDAACGPTPACRP